MCIYVGSVLRSEGGLAFEREVKEVATKTTLEVSGGMNSLNQCLVITIVV